MTADGNRKKVEVIVTDLVTGKKQSMEMVTEDAIEVERIDHPAQYGEYMPPYRMISPPEVDRFIFTVSNIVRREEDGVYLTVHTGDPKDDSIEHFFRRGKPIL